MKQKHSDGSSPKVRKSKDQAFVLPLIGLIFLVPPFANIFQIDSIISGVPFTVLYLFGVWGLLIAGAALLSGNLREELKPHENGETEPKADK